MYSKILYGICVENINVRKLAQNPSSFQGDETEITEMKLISTIVITIIHSKTRSIHVQILGKSYTPFLSVKK